MGRVIRDIAASESSDEERRKTIRNEQKVRRKKKKRKRELTDVHRNILKSKVCIFTVIITKSLL